LLYGRLLGALYGHYSSAQDCELHTLATLIAAPPNSLHPTVRPSARTGLWPTQCQGYKRGRTRTSSS